MYVYEGTGYCVPMNEGQIDDLINAYNEQTGETLEDVFELDDMMVLGDWCSVDNIESAFLNDEEVYGDAGVFVLRDDNGNDELLCELLEQIDLEPDAFHGDFIINCWE